MRRDVELWKHVVSDERLLSRAAAVDPTDVAAVSALRRDAPAQRVAVALELVAARRKLIEKLGPRSAGMVADISGVEQATGGAVGRYKAARFAEWLGHGRAVVDLCCGIGADSLALRDAGVPTVSVDLDPLRAWMAGENLGKHAAVVCADAADLSINSEALHIDPARRAEGSGRRAWRLADYQPGPAVIGRLIGSSSAAAVKLSPGIDLDELPWPGEVEFISEHGRLVQAVLWTGVLAHAARRATLIEDQVVHALSGEPLAPPIGAIRRFVYTFDAAVERAGLIGRLCEAVDAPAAHRQLGLLTHDRVIDSPWLTGFEWIERLPWRPKRVKQWLAAHDGGLVEVKTRGKACDPDREQRTLRGTGGTTYTVFVLRFDTKVEALITRRLSPADRAGPGTDAAGPSA